MNLTFRSAASYSVEAIADLYTRTFAAYFYDALITPALMASFCRIEHIDLYRSPVVCDGAEPVGLATLGLRATHAYCKGFGVVMSHRGRGISHALCAETIRQVRGAGARELTLGVMHRNARAVRTYQRAGLRVARELLSFEWSGADAPALTAPPVRHAAPRELLAAFEPLHAVHAPWRHDLPSLLAMTDLEGFALADRASPAPYLLLQRDAQGTADVMDVGARDPADALGLLRAAQASAPRVEAGSVPAESPLIGALWQAGFQPGILRYEMTMEL